MQDATGGAETPTSALQEYVEAILALQGKHRRGTVLPLAIMTSGDTHDRTEQFLKENKYFGAEPSQITLMKQEKVGPPPEIRPRRTSSVPEDV